jgi:hypothetical protein
MSQKHDHALDATEARRLFDYDWVTGEMTWAVRTKGAVLGARAGCPQTDGYLQVTVRQRRHVVHRVVWLWWYGQWPQQFIDHINLDKGDNRIANLRDVTRSMNQQNQRTVGRTSISGLIGAHYVKRLGRYSSSISVDKRTTHLGFFDTAEEAHACYLEAKARIHPGWANGG